MVQPGLTSPSPSREGQGLNSPSPSGGGQGGGVVVERSVPMAGAVELVLSHPPSPIAIGPGQFFQLAVSAPHPVLPPPHSPASSGPAGGRGGLPFNGRG